MNRRAFMGGIIGVAAAHVVRSQPFATHVIISNRTSVTSEKVTVAQDQSAAASVIIQPTTLVVLASVAGTVRVEHGGTAPTSTRVIPRRMPNAPIPKALGYVASNVGAGTVISIEYVLTAGVERTLDMRNIITAAGLSAVNNVTAVVTLGSTGNVDAALYYRESV